MTVYEFYSRGDSGEFHSIGVLPERRIDPKRITNESIINWGRTFFGMSVKDKAMFFIEILLPEGKVGETEYLNGIIRSLLIAGTAIAVGLIVAHID